MGSVKIEDFSSFSVPVLLLKPFKEVPRFSIGFVQAQFPATVGRGKEDKAVPVYLPLFQDKIGVPASFLKIYKKGVLTDIVKVPIKSLTMAHLDSLAKPIIYLIKAEHKYNTISKTRLYDLLTTLFSVYPYISTGYSVPDKSTPPEKVITKISIMSLKMILPVLANYVNGLYITVCMRRLDHFNEQDQLVLLAAKNWHSNALFDGGPLPLLSQKTQQINLKDLPRFMDKLPIYTIKGDIICAE